MSKVLKFTFKEKDYSQPDSQGMVFGSDSSAEIEMTFTSETEGTFKESWSWNHCAEHERKTSNTQITGSFKTLGEGDSSEYEFTVATYLYRARPNFRKEDLTGKSKKVLVKEINSGSCKAPFSGHDMKLDA